MTNQDEEYKTNARGYVVLESDSKFVTDEDRKRAYRALIKTGKPVVVRTRRGFWRRMGEKLFGG